MTSVRGLKAFVVVAAAVSLVACSKPSEDDARNALESFLQATPVSSGVGRFRLVEFRKTNAVSSSRDDVPMHTVEFEATLECVEDGHPYATSSLRPKQGGAGWKNKGSRHEAVGAVVFEKTERGWRDDFLQQVH